MTVGAASRTPGWARSQSQAAPTISTSMPCMASGSPGKFQWARHRAATPCPASSAPVNGSPVPPPDPASSTAAGASPSASGRKSRPTTSWSRTSDSVTPGPTIARAYDAWAVCSSQEACTVTRIGRNSDRSSGAARSALQKSPNGSIPR